MLTINGKKIMNIEEAVQWLLQNNALPFQCKADYAADTVISMSEIVNPSPAEIKVGAIVFFHDCKIATVTGITSNGFTVGSDHIDMREDLFDGNIHIAGNLSVDGDASVFENIVDKDGHKRFIEDEIQMETISGVTQNYGRWSLSGTHLMLVLAFSVAENIVIPFQNIAYVAIPEWIHDKLTPLITDIVIYKDMVAFAQDSTTISSDVILTKRAGNELGIVCSGLTNDNKAREVRIQFDLLIDNQ